MLKTHLGFNSTSRIKHEFWHIVLVKPKGCVVKVFPSQGWRLASSASHSPTAGLHSQYTSHQFFFNDLMINLKQS